MTQIFFCAECLRSQFVTSNGRGGNRYSTYSWKISNINRLIQVLHSATSATSFSQRNWLFHPTKSNLPPNEVESVTQRSRIFNPAQSYPSPQWNVWTCTMTYMMRKRLFWWEPGRFWNYVPTHFLLRRNVANAASGRNFRFLSWLWFLLSPAISQRSGH